MNIQLLRYSTGNESTLGLLFINGKFACYTLEDQFQAKKVMHETRIPEGRYEITLRKEGTFHTKYSKSFSGIHKGMLWIRNIPGFEYVLIHVGNTDNDTSGCILVGNICTQNILGRGSIAESTVAYKRIYPVIASALEAGEKVFIEIKTL